MEFKSLMHVSFFTDQMDVMRDFYENKLGLKVKIVTRAGLYKGLNRGKYSEVAEVDPNRIIIVYIEIDRYCVYSHFSRHGGAEGRVRLEKGNYPTIRASPNSQRRFLISVCSSMKGKG